MFTDLSAFRGKRVQLRQVTESQICIFLNFLVYTIQYDSMCTVKPLWCILQWACIDLFQTNMSRWQDLFQTHISHSMSRSSQQMLAWKKNYMIVWNIKKVRFVFEPFGCSLFTQFYPCFTAWVWRLVRWKLMILEYCRYGTWMTEQAPSSSYSRFVGCG